MNRTRTPPGRRKQSAPTTGALVARPSEAPTLRSEADIFSAAIGGTERDRRRRTLDDLEKNPPPPLSLSVRSLIEQIEKEEMEKHRR